MIVSNKVVANILLGTSIIFFVAGLSFPILSTKQQILGIALSFEKIWLFTSIKFFLKENEYFLALVILFFTFIFPVIKYIDFINRKI